MRFDGLRLNQTTLEPRNNKSSLLRAMLPRTDGSLWLATGQGRIVRHAPHGPSQAYTGRTSPTRTRCISARGRAARSG